MFDETEKELLSGLLRFCLKQLVDGGHVKWGEITGSFRMDFEATDKLGGTGQAAATVQDQLGYAVVLFDPAFELRVAIWAVPHEAVHVAQYCCGDLTSVGKGRKLWRGEMYDTLPSDDAGYSDQPWEAEAFALDRQLRRAMREHYPELGALLPEEECPER